MAAGWHDADGIPVHKLNATTVGMAEQVAHGGVEHVEAGEKDSTHAGRQDLGDSIREDKI